jgi:hypothetical protein
VVAEGSSSVACPEELQDEEVVAPQRECLTINREKVEDHEK